MKKNIGSTIALAIGILSVIAGLAKPSSTLTGGIIIILGALAYKSAKKRKFGEIKTSLKRKALEAFAIVIIIAAILLQNNAVHYIITDPFPNLIIPLWAIIAYLAIALSKNK